MYRYNVYIHFLFLCILSLFSLSAEANPNFLANFCGNTSFYNPNSTYESNLNTLLSSLSSNATNESGFHNSNAGRDPPNIASGLSLCRGDVTVANCQQCLADASTRIVQSCPRDKMAFIWYDECMLRFSNQPFFSTLEELPGLTKWNPQNMTDPARFMDLLAYQMDNLANRASVTDRSGKKFATSVVNFSRFETLNSLAQCTPDLSESDCNRCLRGEIGQLPGCCYGKQGGRVLNPSCTISYDIVTVTANPPPPATVTTTPPLPPPPPLRDVASTRETKFRAAPDAYEAAIRAQDRARLMDVLTYPSVEEIIKKR